MDDRNRRDSEGNDEDMAPELHNSEQEDEQWQTHNVAKDALHAEARHASPLDSVKSDDPSGVMDDSTQDLIDHMRDMEQSGRIDMDAYLGEPNLDDNEDKYAEGNKVDDLPGDGTTERNKGG
jgi:hypothetical protein